MTAPLAGQWYSVVTDDEFKAAFNPIAAFLCDPTTGCGKSTPTTKHPDGSVTYPDRCSHCGKMFWSNIQPVQPFVSLVAIPSQELQQLRDKAAAQSALIIALERQLRDMTNDANHWRDSFRRLSRQTESDT
jgi:hypothetical protein